MRFFRAVWQVAYKIRGVQPEAKRNSVSFIRSFSFRPESIPIISITADDIFRKNRKEQKFTQVSQKNVKIFVYFSHEFTTTNARIRISSKMEYAIMRNRKEKREWGNTRNGGYPEQKGQINENEKNTNVGSSFL
jgi:hypothetical protein